MFQSSPGLLAGCNSFNCTHDHLGPFQSSPGLLAGCNLRQSTPSRPLSRFHSSPGLLAGCNSRYGSCQTRTSRFNPHPAVWPDATAALVEVKSTGIRFQSSPGLLAGCNLSSLWPLYLSLWVSILTRPSGRMQHGRLRQAHGGRHVSILTRPSGRMQPYRAKGLSAT